MSAENAGPAGRLEVKLEQEISSGADRIWPYLASFDGMRKWLGPVTFDPVPGGRVLFDVKHDNQRWLMFGEIQELQEPSKICFTWQEFNTVSLECWPVPTLVTIAVEPLGSSCRVSLVHSGFEQLPDSRYNYEQYQEGWTARNVLEHLGGMVEG